MKNISNKAGVAIAMGVKERLHNALPYAYISCINIVEAPMSIQFIQPRVIL
jgi:hypothetical protein